ncbi:MAG TPA: DUF2062 domain-containing protein [Steroidobacteraceae bacterium]|nr:DUF2062 domain-containing protein [Steroidobacteraceae bacterium]
MTLPPAPEQRSAIEQAWRRRTLDIVLAQLRQGVTADKIALTLAIGLILGLFPIFGTTSALCVLAALWLKLNQPMIQLINWFAAPLQLPGIYLFVRIGERLTRSAPVQFSIPGLVQQFRASPLQFLRLFGMTGLRGILAWLLIAPAIAAVVYVALLPPLRRLARLREAARVD